MISKAGFYFYIDSPAWLFCTDCCRWTMYNPNCCIFVTCFSSFSYSLSFPQIPSFPSAGTLLLWLLLFFYSLLFSNKSSLPVFLFVIFTSYFYGFLIVAIWSTPTVSFISHLTPSFLYFLFHFFSSIQFLPPDFDCKSQIQTFFLCNNKFYFILLFRWFTLNPFPESNLYKPLFPKGFSIQIKTKLYSFHL